MNIADFVFVGIVDPCGWGYFHDVMRNKSNTPTVGTLLIHEGIYCSSIIQYFNYVAPTILPLVDIAITSVHKNGVTATHLVLVRCEELRTKQVNNNFASHILYTNMSIWNRNTVD